MRFGGLPFGAGRIKMRPVAGLQTFFADLTLLFTLIKKLTILTAI